MNTKEQTHQEREQRKQDREQVCTLIGRQVLRTLGCPAGFQGVQVRRLWKDHYRVNVLVGADVVSAHVGESYFLVADDGGAIINATPTIVRRPEIQSDR